MLKQKKNDKNLYQKIFYKNISEEILFKKKKLRGNDFVRQKKSIKSFNNPKIIFFKKIVDMFYLKDVTYAKREVLLLGNLCMRKNNTNTFNSI